jgi:LAS superfamily LD-carboxypeptidase LdcB
MQSFPTLTSLELTGRAATHVVAVPGLPILLHREVVVPFLAMRAAAAVEGIDLWPVSAYRDFERQRQIWNGKCRGERELLGRGGERLDPASLAPAERVDAILVWSALPGASRHHWGSDVDVIDRAAVPAGQQARLEPQEFTAGAVFGPLDAWLARCAADYGFFRPYAQDLGGVQPEPWHLSYSAVAVQALQGLSLAVLREAVVDAELESQAAVLEQLPQIHARYVQAVATPGAAVLAARALTPASTPS